MTDATVKHEAEKDGGQKKTRNGRTVTVRADAMYGPSVDDPYRSSVRTVSTDGPYGRSVQTVLADGPYGRSVWTVRTDGPCGRSACTVRTDGL